MSVILKKIYKLQGLFLNKRLQKLAIAVHSLKTLPDLKVGLPFIVNCMQQLSLFFKISRASIQNNFAFVCLLVSFFAS